MILMPTQQMNAHQLNALDRLIEECRAFDANVIPVYPHIISGNRHLPFNNLFYHNQTLIGFLSLYFFYEDACEVSLMISPTYRRQSVARQMLAEVLPLVRALPVNDLIFSSIHQTNSTWLKRKGFQYQYSEYKMQRRQKELVELNTAKIDVRVADEHDLSHLYTIDQACFASPETRMSERFQRLLADPDYQILIACLDKQPIGKAHIHWQSNDVHLSDIAILPNQQGQGYGRSLIAQGINHVLKTGCSMLSLDVETGNQNAIKLYKDLGFVTQNICDYWRISIKHL